MWVGFGSGVLMVYLIWVLVNSFSMDSFKEMQNGFLKKMDVFREKDWSFIQRSANAVV